MFVQLVLENLWAVYEATTGGNKGKGCVDPVYRLTPYIRKLILPRSDPALVEKITKSLSITIPQHVLRSRDPRALLTTLFASWLPLSTAVLVSVIEHLPSPPEAQAARLPGMIDSSPGAERIDPSIREAMVNFKTEKDEPVVAYVSKMVAVPESELPTGKRRAGQALTAEEARELGRKKRAEIARAQAAENGGDDEVSSVADALSGAAIGEDEPEKVEEKEDPEHLIGFARLYSGTLSVGDTIYVLPPKFTPARPDAPPLPQAATVTALYLLMGRTLESLSSVPAGTVFGIAGLEGKLLKSGTLCSKSEGAVNLAGIGASAAASAPIVRVALEPTWPGDLDRMIAGIKMLVQSDPCAEYEVLESGEHVISTAGELHLERCLKDLRERFARCDIQAGEPIVPYRESIVAAAEMNPPREKDLPRGTVVGTTTSGMVRIRLRVRPLPAPVTEFLDKHEGVMKRLNAQRRAEELNRVETLSDDEQDVASVDPDGPQSLMVDSGKIMTLAEFRESLKAAFAEIKVDREVWKGAIDQIAALGPRRVSILSTKC